MAEMYKEYLSHVPAKWGTFTDKGFRLSAKDLHFTASMPRTTAESKALVDELEASEEARGARARGANRKRGGDSWAAEMKTIVEAERAKAEADQRAAELEEHIRVKHLRRMAQKERAMVPPTIDGAHMPVAFHALRDTHPAETTRYQAMLSAGGDLAIAMARAKVDAKAQAHQQAREKAQLEHLKKVDESISRAEEERAELMKHFKEANEKAADKATQRRTEQQERDNEARKRAAEQAAEREAKVAARLRAEALARQEEADRAAAEAQAKLDRMQHYKEAVANEFEERLNQQFAVVEERRAIMETMRHQIIAKHEGERIYKEVMERREEQRQAQLQALRKLEERREARSEALVEERHEDLKSLKETHAKREERVDSNKEMLWEKRAPKINSIIDRVHHDERTFHPRERHTPSYLTPSDLSVARAATETRMASTSPLLERSKALLNRPSLHAPTPGLEGMTEARLAHAAALKQKLAEEDAQRRHQAEMQQTARDNQLLSLQVNEYHTTQARLQAEENQRLRIRESAAQRAIDRQHAIDAEAAKRAAASDKHLSELLSEQSRTRAERAATKAQRIAKCLDEVNVVKVKAVHDASRDKAAKRDAFEQQRNAERMEAAMAKAAQLAEKNERMAQAVREAEEARYNAGVERRRQHDEKVAQAAANHERHLEELRNALNDKSVKRAQKVDEAVNMKSARQRQLAEAVQRNDEQLAAALAAAAYEQHQERRRKANATEDKRERFLDNHQEFHRSKVKNALEKALYAHQRAHTSLEIRREAMKSVSPPAVRANSVT